MTRALHLIEEGFLNEASVADLADRLGVGSRHLLRLFIRHTGATPTQVAATRRVQKAKRLLDETQMPMSEIAFTAGFGSVRRFNDAFRGHVWPFAFIIPPGLTCRDKMQRYLRFGRVREKLKQGRSSEPC